jgi:hypothetical protein
MSQKVGISATFSGVTPARLRVREHSAPLAIAAVITGTAAAQGGYFSTAWGWTALALAWALGIAIVSEGGMLLSRQAVLFLGSIAALLGWTLGSALWSFAPWDSVLAAERTLVYVLGAAFVCVTTRRNAASLYGGILLAVVLVSAYGLATRLFPDRIGVFDPIAGYRLSEPIGYWNGLAVFAAMGTLLALGAAAHARHLATRAAAAASIPVLLATQYFTFGRAGWLSLGIGLVAAVALDRRRLRLITVAIAVATPGAVVILAASRQKALTHTGATLPAAAHSGHRLALVVFALAAVSSLLAIAVSKAASALQIRRRHRVAYSATLAACVLVAGIGLLVAAGGPISLAKRGYHSFNVPAPKYSTISPTVERDLDQRLFTFSGNGRAQLWSAAWDEYRSHPLLGSGGGTFQRFWIRDPKANFEVHNAHGLYIETLAELGPIGLALLLIVLALPLVAAAHSRRSMFTAGAAAAYIAFFVHAGVDWDWQLTGVTLAAICCGALLVGLPTQGRAHRELPLLGAVGLLAPLAVFSVIALFGNNALAKSHTALEKRDWVRADEFARSASRWMPWSPSPLTQLGEAQLGEGDPPAARATFRRAISRGSNDWEAWLGLARSTTGSTRAAALDQAKRLNRGLGGN